MKSDRIIALDIGTDGIRLAVVSTGTSTVHDSDFAAYPADVPAELPQEALVAMTLKRLLEGRNPSTNQARISIEGQSVFSRLVKLPMVGSDEQEKTIRHEAVQNIPFPIHEVVWDAHIIDPENPEPEVLLVAVKVELVEGLVHAVRANGLAVEQISVAPVALANALRASGEQGPVLLVDAGEQTANLVFVDGPRIFFRTLPVAGGDPDRLAQEIERSITFYRGQQQGREPERILMIGAGDLSTRFAMPVEQVESISVCGGLAADPAFLINLIPASLQQERELKRRQPLWLISAILLMLMLAVWIVNVHLQMKQSVKVMASVEQQINDLSRIEQTMLPLEARMDELNEQAGRYRITLEQRTLWLETLSEIRGLLPEGMFLISSEPIRPLGQLAGTRISVVSYLDKEPKGQDAVKLLRDALRSCEQFSEKTKVFSRPSKKLFAREFVLDVYFAEDKS
ncbi:pilus assembly protein PilM [Pontiellaceae bacterium B12227]|nr:pilus assembly protein PilM [Pontiellaceae bacterium B12227]